MYPNTNFLVVQFRDVPDKRKNTFNLSPGRHLSPDSSYSIPAVRQSARETGGVLVHAYREPYQRGSHRRSREPGHLSVNWRLPGGTDRSNLLVLLGVGVESSLRPGHGGWRGCAMRWDAALGISGRLRMGSRGTRRHLPARSWASELFAARASSAIRRFYYGGKLHAQCLQAFQNPAATPGIPSRATIPLPGGLGGLGEKSQVTNIADLKTFWLRIPPPSHQLYGRQAVSYPPASIRRGIRSL